MIGLPKRADVAIAAGLFAGSLALLGPWLTTEFSNQPWNNGYIYTAIARMFRDRTSMWNALQYGGSPFHFLYPPLFPTIAAVLRFLAIGRAFHVVAAVGFALGPMCVYVLGRVLFEKRLPAVFGALAYALFPSMIYAFPQMRVLGQPYSYAPWSFVTLVAYDEAPHLFALPFALLAIAAGWRERWGIASLCAAAVLLTSWPGAIGLVFPLLGLAVARRREIANVVGFAGGAYGVAAFWITPSYLVATELFNRTVWRHTTAAGWNGSALVLLAGALLVVGCWKRIAPELALLLVWTALAGGIVLGNFLLPLPHRYLLELSAGLALLLAALASMVPRKLIIAAIVVGAPLSFRFVAHAWTFEPPAAGPGGVQTQAFWLKEHVGRERVMVSGELDSTLSLWTDVAQVGGPGQAARNYLALAAERQIAMGCGADSERIAELWLRAMNAPWLVVHGAASREFFHWYADLKRFAGLPVAMDNGAGDTIYRLNFDPQEAVVVDLPSLPPLTSTADMRFLDTYVNWAEGKRSVAVRWSSPGKAEFDVNLAANEAVLLKINHDTGWRASGATIVSDPIGFQLIRLAPGEHHVSLRYGASWDTWLGRAITLVTLILILARVKPIWIAIVAVIPSAGAVAYLLSTAPPTVRIAEEAFTRLHPPIINGGGIINSGGELSIYGTDLAGPNTRVWIGDRASPADFTSPGQVNVRLPRDVPASADIRVEVNGCIGNAFRVPTR